MEKEPIASNQEGRMRGKIAEDFLVRVLTDSSITTPEEAGDRMVEYFPVWKDGFIRDILNGKTENYSTKDIPALLRISMMSVLAHSKKESHRSSKLREDLVRKGTYSGSEEYKDAQERVLDWDLAYKSSLYAVRKEVRIKTESKVIADDVSEEINKEFAARLGLDNSRVTRRLTEKYDYTRREALRDNKKREYMKKFIEKHLIGIGGQARSFSDEKRIEILTDEFDLFVNGEISRLHKSDSKAAEWNIGIVEELDLDLGADMIDELINNYISQAGEHVDSRYVNDWRDMQKIFLEAGQIERDNLQP